MDRVIREISRTLLKPGPDIADGQLLELFRVRRDEAAFEAIVQRHGPMVLAACRRILGNHHDAEDAFQATFLVLARKSAAIAPRNMAASWLYEVAVRTAQKARTQAARIRRRERRAALPLDLRTRAHESEVDLQDTLDRELARLSEKYRSPIVLCELEGKSHKEAARQLRWPEGTLSVRLMRAKKLLAQRLSRQGLGTTAGAIAILSAASSARASVPSALANSAASFATMFVDNSAASVIPAKVAALAGEVVRGLFMSKMRMLVGSIAILGLLIGGASFSVRALPAGFQAAKAVDALVAQAPQEPKKERGDVPDDKSAVVASGSKKQRLDAFGDPLPAGAAFRLGARRFRDDGENEALAFTPDGKTLVGRSASGVVVWDAATGIERYRLHSLNGNGIGVSPDGATLAISEVVGLGAAIGLWDLRTGKRTRTLSFPKDEAKNAQPDELRFTRDGKSLAVSSTGKGKAVVFDLASAQIRASFGGTDESYVCSNIAVSSDSKTLVAVQYPWNNKNGLGAPHGLHWWDIATGKRIHAIHELPHDGAKTFVRSMAFSPDDKTLALGMLDKILLFDSATGKEKGRLAAEKMGQITGIAFTPDGKKLVSGGEYDGAIRILDLGTGKALHVLKGRMFLGRSMALSPDGKTVALGGIGTVVRLWDVATGEELFGDRHGHDSGIHVLAISPDGKTLASAGDFRQTFLWDWASKERIGILPVSATVLSFSSDGKQLASVAGNTSARDKVQVWNVETRKEALQLTVPDVKEVVAVTFAPEGQKLFTLDYVRGVVHGSRSTVRLWDLATKKEVQSWPMPDGERPRYLSPSGKTIFNRGQVNDNINIFDARTGRRKALPGEVSPGPYSISPDGRLAGAVLKNQDSVELCEILSGQEIFVLKGDRASVAAIAWSRDGRLVATGEDSAPRDAKPQSVRVWDTATGKQRAIFGGLRSDVTALVFSPDGTALVAGLRDGTILIWESADAIPRIPAANLSRVELEARWTDLISDQAAQAHKAIGILVAAPRQAVPFLRERLRPTPVTDASKIQRWITDLDKEFAVRESASKELSKIAAQIEPQVRKVLEGEVPPETRRRLEGILAKADSPDASTVRTIRAITVLERIGSPDARAVLETLARGAPGSHATEEAAASLQRLTRTR